MRPNDGGSTMALFIVHINECGSREKWQLPKINSSITKDRKC